MNRNILALDIGTQTGWALSCVSTDTKQLDSGMQKFTTKKKEHSALRWMRFKAWVNQMISEKNIHAVYYERVMNHAGIRAGHCYGAFEAIIEVACYTHNCEITGIGVGTIKKFATGKGNASKQEMVHAAYEAGFAVRGDDEADAIHLLRYALSLEAE